MSSLDALIQAQQKLVEAIDARDAARIEAATAAMEGIVAQLRDGGVESLRRADVNRLAQAREENVAAARSVNHLTQSVRTRLERLESLRGRGPAGSYTSH